MRKFKTYNNEKKPYLKNNEVCLLSPNFKLASKSEKKHFIFIIKKKQKTHKNIEYKK